MKTFAFSIAKECEVPEMIISETYNPETQVLFSEEGIFAEPGGCYSAYYAGSIGRFPIYSGGFIVPDDWSNSDAPRWYCD
jgi:hypothetical protein